MITQLYPAPQCEHKRVGHYLQERLHTLTEDGQTFVYANYVSSVDGRIATENDNGEMGVPQGVQNDNDWRFFQELAAQADLLLVSSRHLRQVANNPDAYMAQWQREKYADLGRWRQNNGFRLFPDTAVISRSLNFPVPPSLLENGRKLIVFTPADAKQSEVARLKKEGAEVILCGKSELDVKKMVDAFADRGYRTAYITFGPGGLHALLQARIVQRLYLTLAHRLIAGNPFQPLTEGELFDPPLDLKLRSLYLDSDPLNGSGQLYLSYKIER